MVVEVLQSTYERPRLHWSWYTDVVEIYTTENCLVLRGVSGRWPLFRDQIAAVYVDES